MVLMVSAVSCQSKNEIQPKDKSQLGCSQECSRFGTMSQEDTLPAGCDCNVTPKTPN